MAPQKPVLLVTGASRGIGAACAKLAGAHRFKVGVNYLRDRRPGDEVVGAIRASGGNAVAIQGDMKAEADIERVLQTLEREFGRLTHLVYNSGITGAASRLEAAKTETLREVLDLNVLGALLCVRAAVPPHLDQARRCGRRDRADLIGGGNARQPRRICLVRRLQRRGRIDDGRG